MYQFTVQRGRALVGSGDDWWLGAEASGRFGILKRNLQGLVSMQVILLINVLPKIPESRRLFVEVGRMVD